METVKKLLSDLSYNASQFGCRGRRLCNVTNLCGALKQLVKRFRVDFGACLADSRVADPAPGCVAEPFCFQIRRPAAVSDRSQHCPRKAQLPIPRKIHFFVARIPFLKCFLCNDFFDFPQIFCLCFHRCHLLWLYYFSVSFACISVKFVTLMWASAPTNE